MNPLTEELDRELIANHRSDAGMYERLADQQRRLGLLHDDRPICPFLRPYFLSESRYRAICHAARHLSTAFEKLTGTVLESPDLIDELAISEKEYRWARLEPGYRCVSVNSRLDSFLRPDGFSFLEYNAENPAGIGDQSSLETLFTAVPEVVGFLEGNAHYYPKPQRKLLDALDATYREFGGRKAHPSIAIVDWKDVSTRAEFDILREFFESLGYPTRICDPTELEFDGDALRHGDFEIDIFFKRVIIHEFLARFDESHPVFKAIENGAVCLANSFRSKIPHKKSSFAVLSNERYRRLFTSVELEAIDLHIPWTRRVRDERTTFAGEEVELIDLIHDERDRFVLKPNDDYGGKGIALGWECSESEWDDAIEMAIREPYVVQERVEVEKTAIPFFFEGDEVRYEELLVDFDPFLFRGEVEGGMVRLSSNSLVNVSQGGGETALVIVADS